MLLTLVECVKYQGADQAIKMYCIYWPFQIRGSAAYYLWAGQEQLPAENIESDLDTLFQSGVCGYLVSI